MRKATLALLAGAYLLTALLLAALVWRAGPVWASAAGVALGAVGVLLGLHDLIARHVSAGAFGRELSRLREAHLILADQVEGTRAAMGGLADRVHAETSEQAQAITSEVRMLEALVERMGEDLDARLSTPHPALAQGRDHQADALLQTIREALAANRVDLYLQPVVSLPQRRTVFYEGFSRLRNETGRVLMPAEYLRVAEPEGLISAIDNLLLFRAVQIVRRLAKQDRKIGIFCNISLASLGDEQFFPQFLDFLGKNRDLSGALIFELGLSAFRERGALEARNMAKLADLGFRFSIDKVSDLELDFADLSRADVKFIKIAADVLLTRLLDGEGRAGSRALRDLHAADFAALTRRYGVEAIAEKVETERQVIDILELDLAYGQGHQFGEPRAIVKTGGVPLTVLDSVIARWTASMAG